MRTRSIYYVHESTVKALSARKNGTLRALAADLDLPASAAATLSGATAQTWSGHTDRQKSFAPSSGATYVS